MEDRDDTCVTAFGSNNPKMALIFGTDLNLVMWLIYSSCIASGACA